MLQAITRAVSRSITQCELTYLSRVPIDLDTARRQHLAYEQALRSLGVTVFSLPEQAHLPDSVFVEDTAIVVDECAILTRPGAVTRRPEVASIAQALRRQRDLMQIKAPAVLDGGDVLVAGRKVWVGLSGRSNRAGIWQLTRLLTPHGYQVQGVEVHGCLHLKSAVTQVAPATLLINPRWVDRAVFPGMDFIEVHPSEPSGGNVLWVGETVLCQPVFPRTHARLQAAGFRTMLVDSSELAKAEGALTCCSLIYKEN